MSTTARPALVIRKYESSHWVPWAIFALDVFALELAFISGLTVRWILSAWFTAEIGVEQYLGVAVALLLVPAVHYQIGLYPGYLLSPVERLRRRTLATAAVFGGLVAWDNIVARGVLSRGVLLATFVFALVLPAAVESLARMALVRTKQWGIPVLVIGAGEAGCALARTLAADPYIGLVPVAFLDDRPEMWNTFAENVPVIGPVGIAPDFEHCVEAVIVALDEMRKHELPELNFPRVIVIPNLEGMGTLWVTARNLGGCLGLEVKKNLLIRRNTLLKQLMDRVVAVPLFLASIPVIAVAALCIKLTSSGPIFYRQMREGRDGRRISVWKLRTMYVDGDRRLQEWFETHPEDATVWRRYFKLRHDPRVLPVVGRFLRRTSLDELPQLWSILKGEMSLVGPRPFPDYHLENFPPDFRSLRTRVLPGLTGLWQISARSDGDIQVQEALDTFYIRNWSPWLDVYILVRTVAAVALARGAY